MHRHTAANVASLLSPPSGTRALAMTTPTVTTDPQFPGIHFLGTPWKETVTSEGLEISWKDIGITFNIPPGAVPEDKELKLIVRPCLTGPFKAPDGNELTSPVYIISPAFDFIKDIQLVLYHFANVESDKDCEHMSFITAPSSTGSQPQYRFKQLKGGVFLKRQHFGTIYLRHFCGLATSRKVEPNERSKGKFDPVLTCRCLISTQLQCKWVLVKLP